jgi:hypothetical protein
MSVLTCRCRVEIVEGKPEATVTAWRLIPKIDLKIE